MKKKPFENLDIRNNDYIKIYLRLLKEENIYNCNDFLSSSRYNEMMNDKLRLYKINAIKWIMSIPDLLTSINTNYNEYYNIHAKYIVIILDDMITTSLKTLYKTIESNELKTNLNKNRKQIKKDIKNIFITKINKRNLNGSFYFTFTKIIYDVLFKYNVKSKSITQRNIDNILIKKRKYNIIKKN